MGSNPSEHRDPNFPVETVSWFDCVQFCNALSTAEGLESVYSIGEDDESIVRLDLGRTGYRLPTEAEWEYMAKAGTDFTYAGSNNIDEVVWYAGNADWIHHVVAQKKPNSWGIYDCNGNISEWCSDRWSDAAYQGRTGTTCDPHEWVDSESPRVRRGGNRFSIDLDCRVASRQGLEAGDRHRFHGFRVLRCA